MLRIGPLFSANCTLPVGTPLRIWAAIALAAGASAGRCLAQSPSGSAPADAASSGLILLLSILILAVVFALWKFVFRMIGRMFRAAAPRIGRWLRPLVKRLVRFLRLLRLVPREPRPLVAPSVAGVTMGTIGRTVAGGSETEEAIASGADRQELEFMVQRNRGLFCTWLAPAPAPRVAYDATAAEADRENVKRFFGARVPVYFNPLNLYEDADGAFIVGLFRNSDRRVFHVLSEFRKTINRNVLWLSILISIVASVVAVANVFLSTTIPFNSYSYLGSLKEYPYPSFSLSGLGFEWRPMPREVLDKFVFGVLSCFIGWAIMWLFYHTEYVQFQRNNGQQMSNFLQHYMEGVNSSFKDISRNAQATVAQEREDAEMEQDAVLWVTSLQWTAFRAFYIECYLRNVLFQVHRNSSYYVLFTPLSFIALFLVVAWGFPQFNVFSLEGELYRQNSFYLFFLVLLFACYRYLHNALSFIWLSIFTKTDDATGERVGGWTKFHDLDIQKNIGETLETYIRALVRWRNMMKSRG
jgi:hypothetical protein